MKEYVSIRDIIGCFASQAYKMHPYNDPPNVDKIVKYLSEELKKEFVSSGNCIEIDDEDFYKKTNEILMGCLEFRQLNISKHRWHLGQRDIDNESDYLSSKSLNPKENDFIDLRALLQNFNYELWTLIDAEKDCFLCKFAKEYGSMEPSECEECKTCLCNPKRKCNRIVHPWALLPRNSEEYQELVKNGSIKGMEF